MNMHPTHQNLPLILPQLLSTYSFSGTDGIIALKMTYHHTGKADPQRKNSKKFQLDPTFNVLQLFYEFLLSL